MHGLALLAFMMVAFFSSIGFGFKSIGSTREDLRATQLMMQKLEAVRLCRWSQLTNCPTTFSDSLVPTATNGLTGTIYGGTLNTLGAANSLPAAYRDKVRLITVSVTWTNGTGNNKIVRTRQMQTLSAYNGIQNYIYGYTTK